MMKRIFPLIAATLALTTGITEGAITLDISLGGFENGSSVATNGMSYGFLIDTGSDGFALGSYLAFDITENGQFLPVSAGLSNDWFVYGGTQGTGQTPPVTAFGGPLGNGAIGSVSNIGETNISTGLNFAVIWFPDNTASIAESAYGATSDGGINMVTPGSGGSNIAPDSVMTLVPQFTIVAAVPEPSTYGLILGLVTFLGLGYRRRLS